MKGTDISADFGKAEWGLEGTLASSQVLMQRAVSRGLRCVCGEGKESCLFQLQSGKHSMWPPWKAFLLTSWAFS